MQDPWASVLEEDQEPKSTAKKQEPQKAIDQDPWAIVNDEKPKTGTQYSKKDRKQLAESEVQEKNRRNAARQAEPSRDAAYTTEINRRNQAANEARANFDILGTIKNRWAATQTPEDFERAQQAEATGQELDRGILGSFAEGSARLTRALPGGEQAIQAAGSVAKGVGQTIGAVARAGMQSVTNPNPFDKDAEPVMWARYEDEREQEYQASQRKRFGAIEDAGAELQAIPFAESWQALKTTKDSRALDIAESTIKSNLRLKRLQADPLYAKQLADAQDKRENAPQDLTQDEAILLDDADKSGVIGFLNGFGETMKKIATDPDAQEGFGKSVMTDAVLFLIGTGAIRGSIELLKTGVDAAKIYRLERNIEKAKELRDQAQNSEQIARIDKALDSQRQAVLQEMSKTSMITPLAEFAAIEGGVGGALEVGRQEILQAPIDGETLGQGFAQGLLEGAVLEGGPIGLARDVQATQQGAGRDLDSQTALRESLYFGDRTDIDSRAQELQNIKNIKSRNDLKKAGEIIAEERTQTNARDQYRDNKINLADLQGTIYLTKEQAEAQGYGDLYNSSRMEVLKTRKELEQAGMSAEQIDAMGQEVERNGKTGYLVKSFKQGGNIDAGGKITLLPGFNRADYREEHAHALQKRLSKFDRSGKVPAAENADLAKAYQEHEAELEEYALKKGIKPNQIAAWVDEQIAKSLVVQGADVRTEAARQYAFGNQIDSKAPKMGMKLAADLRKAQKGELVIKPRESVQKQVVEKQVVVDRVVPGPERIVEKRVVDMEDDAEGRAILPKIPKGKTSAGKGGRIYTDEGEEIPFRWAVIDERQVQATLDSNAANQPRDRKRAASDMQVQNLAKKFLFKKASGAGEAMNQGSPVLTKDGTILAGNGRMAAVALGYERGEQSLAKYKEEVRANAEKYGIDPEQVKRYDRPVLIRVVDLESSDQANVRRLAKLSNAEGTKSDSAAESAKKDAAALDLDQFAADQDLLGKANNRFVQKFVDSIDPKDRDQVLDAQGNFSADGVKRLERAILRKAFGEHPIINEMIEAADTESKNVLAGLKQASPLLAKDGNQELASKVLKAVQWLRLSNAQGITPEEKALQVDLTEEIDPFAVTLAQYMKDNARSAKKLSEIITDVADRASTPAEPDMFGEVVKKDLINHLQEAIQGERSLENVSNEMRFSLKGPLEDRQLVLTHNISFDGLKAAYDLGGIPMLSLAVAKVDNPLSGYGDITLVADPNEWRPSKTTPLFAADIYSVRIPTERIKFKYDRKKVNQKTKELEASLKGMGPKEQSYFRVDLEKITPRSITDLMDNPLFKWWFATKKGLNPKLAYETKSKDLEPAFNKFLGKSRVDLLNDKEFLETTEGLHLLRREQESPGGLKRHKAIWDSNQNYRNLLIEKKIQEIQEASKGAETNFDFWQTEKDLRKLVNDADLQDELRQEAFNVIDDVIEGKRLSVGNDRYKPYTLENIAALMKKDIKESKSIRGSEQFAYGSLGSARAQVTPEIKSWDQARKMQDRIIKDAKETWQELEKQWNKSISPLIEQIEKDRGYRFSKGEILRTIPKMKIDQIKYQFDLIEWQAEELKDFVQALVDLPTDYFEMKSLKPVDLREFSTAIIPTDTPKAVRDILESKRLNIIESDDKAEALKGLEDLRFSLKESIEVDGKERPTKNSNGQPIAQTEEGLRNFWKWFGDSKVVNRKGEPIVLYHGTGNNWFANKNQFEGFNVFGKNDLGFYYGSDNEHLRFGHGFYFTNKQDVAASYASNHYDESFIEDEGYGQIMPVYLKIENPARNAFINKNAEKLDSFDNYEKLELFQEKNFDGIIFKYEEKEEGSEYIVFNREQIKSATGNTGEFSPDNADIRFSLSIPPQPGQEPNIIDQISDALYQKFGPSYDKAYQWILDETNPMRRAGQKAGLIGRDSRPVNDAAAAADPWSSNQRRPGIVRDKLNWAERLTKKALKALRAEGLTAEEAGDYLYALHAPERNDAMKARNPSQEAMRQYLKDLERGNDFKDTWDDQEWAEAAKEKATAFYNPQKTPTELQKENFLKTYRTQDQIDAGLSGMTYEQAEEIKKQYENSPAMQQLERLAKQIRSRALAEMRTTGLESPERLAALRAQYKNYVPLQSFEDPLVKESMEMMGANLSGGGGGRGLNVQGSQIRRAAGRTSKAENPLAHLLAQYQNIVERGQRNIIGQQFARLTEDYPTGPWREWEPQKERVVGKDGIVEIKTKSTPPGNTFAYRQNGENKYIQITDKDLLKALGSLDDTKKDVMTKIMGKFNRVLGSLITSLNPVFMLTNFVRDMQAVALTSLTDHDLKTAAKTMTSYARAMGSLRKDAQGLAAQTKMQRYAREFATSGARTGYTMTLNADQQVKALTNRLEAGPVRNAFMEAIEWVEEWNDTIENTGRLAYFAALRDQGYSKERAAFLAKNLTVNFNKHGSALKTLNAFYLFLNAVVQGNVRFLKFAKSPRGIAAIGTLAAAGLMMDFVNSILSPEDDERKKKEWDKKRMSEKETSWILMNPTGETDIKFPMGYGLNVPITMGQILGQAIRGERKGADDALAGMMGAAFNGYSPIKAPTLAQAITPTPFRVLGVDLAINKDYKGDPITRPRNRGDVAPDSERGTSRTSKTSTAIAQGLNRATGGSETESGTIDWDPNAIDYTFGALTGGLGKFGKDIFNLPIEAYQRATDSTKAKEPFDVYKVPFASKLMARRSEYLNQSEARDLEPRLDQLKKKLKSDPQFRKENKDLVVLLRKADATDKQAERIREIAKRKGEKPDPAKLDSIYGKLLRITDSLGINPDEPIR